MSLLAIEMGLKLRFPEESVEILSEISTINDLDLLKAIASQVTNINSVAELRQIYATNID